MAKYDLTAVLAKNLDKHLVFPLLEFLSMKELYPEADIEKAKIELVEKTNMVDFLMDIWASHYKTEPPAEFKERRNRVVEKLNTLQVRAHQPAGRLRNMGAYAIDRRSSSSCFPPAIAARWRADYRAELISVLCERISSPGSGLAGTSRQHRLLPQQRQPGEAAEARQGVQPAAAARAV